MFRPNVKRKRERSEIGRAGRNFKDGCSKLDQGSGGISWEGFMGWGPILAGISAQRGVGNV